MTTKDKYSKILENVKLHYSTAHLSRDSKINLEMCVEIIEKLLKTSALDDNELKKQCDYILVGALICTMAQTDSHCWLEDNFLYPIGEAEVYKGSIVEGEEAFQHGFNFIGRRALESKDLPFTGSFNPECFPGLDSVFEQDHFSEYNLNTDPFTMLHPLKKHKQALLALQITTIEEILLDQMVDAANRSEDKTPFRDLVNDVLTLSEEFKNKLNHHVVTNEDIAEFKRDFVTIMNKPEYVGAINAHRGSWMWRGFMDALAKIEVWIRQIPELVSLRAFSLAPKDSFFSTNTARASEYLCDKVSEFPLR